MGKPAETRKTHVCNGLRAKAEACPTGHGACTSPGAMLKITIETETDKVSLKLEGELAGPWVRDLETSWRLVARASSIRALPVSIDLADCSRVDEAGQYLLALLHLSGTRLVARGVGMTELVESLTKDWPTAARRAASCA